MSTYQGWFFLEVLKCLPTQIHNSYFFILHTYALLRESTQYMNEFQIIETMSTNLPSLHSEDHELDDVHISWTRQDYILATILFFSADMNDAVYLHKYCLVIMGKLEPCLGCGLDSHSCQTRITATNINQWLGDIVSISVFHSDFGLVASYQGN